jgi:hypothetical protein
MVIGASGAPSRTDSSRIAYVPGNSRSVSPGTRPDIARANVFHGVAALCAATSLPASSPAGPTKNVRPPGGGSCEPATLMSPLGLREATLFQTW